MSVGYVIAYMFFRRSSSPDHFTNPDFVFVCVIHRRNFRKKTKKFVDPTSIRIFVRDIFFTRQTKVTATHTSALHKVFPSHIRYRSNQLHRPRHGENGLETIQHIILACVCGKRKSLKTALGPNTPPLLCSVNNNFKTNTHFDYSVQSAAVAETAPFSVYRSNWCARL